MWDSSPNCGISREGKQKREREFDLKKALTHSLARALTKDWANTKGEQAGCVQVPPRCGRQRSMRATARAWRQGAAPISAPETQRSASSTKLWAGSQLLTMSSWDFGWLTSARRVTAWYQLPRGHIWRTWDDALTAHPGNQAARAGEVIKMYSLPGIVHSPSTWSPELLRPGKGTKCTPNWVCALAEYLRTWTWAALTWEVHEMQGPLWTVPCRAPWSLISVDLESICRCELGQTQCGPSTVSTPHTCQWYLFAVFLPPHNTTEQMNLNKRPPSPPQTPEIRHQKIFKQRKPK